MVDDLRSQFNDPKFLLGQQSGSDIPLSSLAPTANKLSSGGRDSQEAKDKRLADFLKILETMQSYINRLEDEIEEMEQGFRNRDGDEWREKLALKILDADDIPQRRTGESMEDYRERLEPLLIKEMLNPDGSIKARYENDPELGDYAQWAQKLYHLNMARGYVQELDDPSTTPERRENIHDWFKNNSDIEALALAAYEAENKNGIKGEIKDIADTRDDVSLNNNQSAHSNDFIRP